MKYKIIKKVYNYLKQLSPNDSFWVKDKYTKQFCFKDLMQLSDNQVEMKEWYDNQLKYWNKTQMLRLKVD